MVSSSSSGSGRNICGAGLTIFVVDGRMITGGGRGFCEDDEREIVEEGVAGVRAPVRIEVTVGACRGIGARVRAGAGATTLGFGAGRLATEGRADADRDRVEADRDGLTLCDRRRILFLV